MVVSAFASRWDRNGTPACSRLKAWAALPAYRLSRRWRDRASGCPRAAFGVRLPRLAADRMVNRNKWISPFVYAGLLGFPVVGWAGLEPATNGLKGRCSTD